MTDLTLLSLASKQIWPQVLTVLDKKPQRLVLFHTDDEAESKRPAGRLKELFVSQGIMGPNAVELQPVPHADFPNIVDTMASVAESVF